MRPPLLPVLFAVGLFSVILGQTVPSGRCEPFIGAPDACVDWLLYDTVFVADNSSQFITAAGVVAVLQAELVIQTPCQLGFAKYACAASFPQCVEIPSGPNTTFAVPVYPCRDVCENFIESCKDSFECRGIASFLPDCSQFPEDPPLCQRNYATDESALATGHYDQTCPEYMKASDDPCLACRPECPLGTWDDSFYWAYWISVLVLAWIGFIFCFSVAFRFWVDPSKWKFPHYLLAIYFTLQAGYALTNAQPWPWYELTCTEDGANNSAMDAGAEPEVIPCVIIGTLGYFFTAASVMWWLAITFNLTWSLLGFKFIPQMVLNIIFHALAWLLPLAGVIAGLAGQRFGAGNQSVTCWLLSEPLDDEDDPEIAYIWGDVLFYVPLALATGIWTILMGISLTILLKTTGISGLWRHKRLLLFSLYYGIIQFTYSGLHYFWLRVKYIDWYDSTTDWFVCLYNTLIATHDTDSYSQCDDKIDGTTPPEFVYIYTIVGISSTIATPVLFAYSKDFFMWYYLFISGIFVGKWNVTGSTTSGSSSGSAVALEMSNMDHSVLEGEGEGQGASSEGEAHEAEEEEEPEEENSEKEEEGEKSESEKEEKTEENSEKETEKEDESESEEESDESEG